VDYAHDMDEDQKELIIKMSEGNPGAINVLLALSQEPDGFWDILELNRQGVKGSLIWMRYKDVCGEDIDALRENIRVTAAEHQVSDGPSDIPGISL
jgi:hypothetical protein